MTSIPFCKFHGFGNDYIVIEKASIPGNIKLPDLALSMCHRYTGVGSDGLAILEQKEDDDADYFCEIVNPDGTFAGFSGNGTRCAVSYLYFKKLWSEPSLRLRTRSGIKNYSLIERRSDGHYWFEAEIGKPKFASIEVPFSSEQPLESVIDQPILIAGERFRVSCVNVGNPVACIFLDDFDFGWRSIGREAESHSAFPERANIVFVKIIDDENIEIRIWERGAGETAASGTASSGAAVLSAFTERTGRTVSVLSEGGTTEVHWRNDDEILLTGRADLAFCGEWLA
jgi:diaminopimelate epimerase